MNWLSLGLNESFGGGFFPPFACSHRCILVASLRRWRLTAGFQQVQPFQVCWQKTRAQQNLLSKDQGES